MNDAGAGGARAAMTNVQRSACNPNRTAAEAVATVPATESSAADPSAADPSAADPSAAEPAAESSAADPKILCTVIFSDSVTDAIARRFRSYTDGRSDR